MTKKQKKRKSVRENTTMFVDDSEVTALHFKSERVFDRAVDAIMGEYKNVQAIGFNVLLVPTGHLSDIGKILKKAEIQYREVPIVAGSDLTEIEWQEIQREEAERGSFADIIRKRVKNDDWSD